VAFNIISGYLPCKQVKSYGKYTLINSWYKNLS